MGRCMNLLSYLLCPIAISIKFYLRYATQIDEEINFNSSELIMKFDPGVSNYIHDLETLSNYQYMPASLIDHKQDFRIIK